MFKTKTIVRDNKRMSEPDRKEAFCVSAEDNFFCAVLDVLSDHIDDARPMARDVRTAKDPGTLAFSAGGMDALETLYADLVTRREEANK